VLKKTIGQFNWKVGGILSTDSGILFAGYEDTFYAFGVYRPRA
jgi:hypothetical protein